ncbi:hypothetical protein GH714_018779 [Hevea brasiliensis]|uniref:Ubiquitin-like protease family profile domain-containing protein n=1 Tax=Hevea brasiliensis TaxID=3981 RepID=A0A6A6MDF1_HEVBR|nr:hypothetical protein GH714_018779 [Hevea brasiliensis]
MHQTPNQTLGSSNSTVSRISRYPETTSKIRREVHAPCRILKFGLSRSKDADYGEKNKCSADDMGNCLSKQLDFAKRNAIGTFRYLLKDKQIIDADNELENPEKQAVSDDSSIEEVEAIEEDGREGRSMVLGQRSRDDLVGNKDDNDVKIVEERSVVTVDGNLGVQNAEKMLNSLVLNGEVNEIPREPFIALMEEEEALVKHAFSPNSRRKVLVTHKNSNIDITGEILLCLRPGAWLNDEVINVYLELLKEREKREPHKFLTCHFFNTFFYKKLTSAENIYDYRAVRRWTTERKLGYFLLECDKIFVPVHREIHWCLAIINKKDQKFQYLDSLKGRDLRVLENLAKYYVEEVKDKSKKDIDVSNWEREFLEDLPEQQNGYDCGVFMIKYADFYSRGIGLCFGQGVLIYK